MAKDDDTPDGDAGAALGTDGISDEELSRRVVYAALLPAVRLAYALRIPVKELEKWLQVAYFHETRRQGLKMHEAAERLDVSMRKTAQLSSQLKKNFAGHAEVTELPRRVEFMLWAEPLSAARIKQTLPEEDDAEIDEAIAQLEREGRIRLTDEATPRYEVVRDEARLVTDRLLTRLDGLTNLLGNVTDAVHSRFLDDEPHSFARTLDFRIRSAAVIRLRDLYDEVLFETLRRLDAEAKATGGDEPVETLSLSILWAPHEKLPKRMREELEAARDAAGESPEGRDED